MLYYLQQPPVGCFPGTLTVAKLTVFRAFFFCGFLSSTDYIIPHLRQKSIVFGIFFYFYDISQLLLAHLCTITIRPYRESSRGVNYLSLSFLFLIRSIILSNTFCTPSGRKSISAIFSVIDINSSTQNARTIAVRRKFVPNSTSA